MKTKDSLGDRMKRYEAQGTEDRMIPGLPVLVRLDGMAFHTFTKGLQRPFDGRFSLCMIEAMTALVNKYNADLAYTQSDEITLYFENADVHTPMPFDGRKHKLISAFASCATGAFIRGVNNNLPMKTHLDPQFDCRIWHVPNTIEVYHSFLWREDDATKNSLSMAAQSLYTQKELHKKGRTELHDLLHAKGVNWNDYPAFFKRGTYARRVKIQKTLTEAELARIPAANRPTGPIWRSEVRCLDIPPIQAYADMADFQYLLTSNETLTRQPLE